MFALFIYTNILIAILAVILSFEDIYYDSWVLWGVFIAVFWFGYVGYRIKEKEQSTRKGEGILG